MQTAVAKQNFRISSGRISPTCAWSKSRRNARFSSISATSPLTYIEISDIKDSIRIEPGTGKTTMLRHLKEEMEGAEYAVPYLSDSQMTPCNFYNNLLE